MLAARALSMTCPTPRGTRDSDYAHCRTGLKSKVAEPYSATSAAVILAFSAPGIRRPRKHHRSTWCIRYRRGLPIFVTSSQTSRALLQSRQHRRLSRLVQKTPLRSDPRRSASRRQDYRAASCVGALSVKRGQGRPRICPGLPERAKWPPGAHHNPPSAPARSPNRDT